MVNSIRNLNMISNCIIFGLIETKSSNKSLKLIYLVIYFSFEIIVEFVNLSLDMARLLYY